MSAGSGTIFAAYQSPANNFNMYHTMRFFLLGIGKGLRPSEDICRTLGTTINVIENSVRMLLRMLCKTTQNFPVLVPEYEWCVGTYAWANGRTEDALVHWENQLHVSTALGMQRHTALAHFELARASTQWYALDSMTSTRVGADIDEQHRQNVADHSIPANLKEGDPGWEVRKAQNERNEHLAKAKSICEAIEARGLLQCIEEEGKISTRQDCRRFVLDALKTEAVGAPLPVFGTVDFQNFWVNK